MTSDEKLRMCPRCGNTKIAYRPGIDIGMMHAICMNCGYNANAPLFPEISSSDAKKIKVKTGKELDEIRHKNAKTRSKKKLLVLAAVVIFFIIAFFMIY